MDPSSTSLPPPKGPPSRQRQHQHQLPHPPPPPPPPHPPHQHHPQAQQRPRHQLSPARHRHHSRPQPLHPPPRPFRVSALPSHPPGLDLGPLDPTADPSFFESNLQPLPGASSLAVANDGYVPRDQDGALRQQSAADHRARLEAHPAPAAAPPPPAPAPAPPPPYSAPPGRGTFGVLKPNPLPPSNPVAPLQQEDDTLAAPPASSSTADPSEQRRHGQLVSRIVVEPPELLSWRHKLFNVDSTIVLTNDEFETYFPHIDNVYSHRSTQKYKRKPFVSHYWDCRMKGRPPGTPKSDDPSKKKRKRNARERDLCDVKIKITEYFPGASLQLDADSGLGSSQPGAYGSDRLHDLPRAAGEKVWTIQRVNGNGGNGKGDGVAGPHKHTLAKSDEIKKCTVQRYLAVQEKEAKKSSKPIERRPSGAALTTAKKHHKEHQLKLYAACFCPFSQRVWIALEVKGLQYQYCETDPFKRPTQLLEANPRGTVPAIREGDWASGESTIILEYLEDRDRDVPLFPTNPRLKANCRLWIDHINGKIVPTFYALLKAVEFSKQSECIEKLRGDITALVQAADERGPYFLGVDLCLVDIHLAPFVLRLSRLLHEFRSWSDSMDGTDTRWQRWTEALEQNPHIQATTSSTELYVETFDIFSRGRLPSASSST